MNRGFVFLLTVPILFLAMSFLLLVQTIQQEERQLEEYVLTFALDYATEAATEEMTNMAHLGQDYQEDGKTYVDPDVALDTFLTLMCMNYDLPLTDTAKLQIESSYLPVFCVAAYDGYYLYTQCSDGEGGVRLYSDPKKPYSYAEGSKCYAFTLSEDYTYVLEGGSLTRKTLSDCGLNRAGVNRIINSSVSDAVTYAFQVATGRTGDFVYLPSALTTFKQVNPITGPSVIALVEGWDVGTAGTLSAYSIGGARVETTRMVAGYRVLNPDGSSTLLYAYADVLPSTFDTDTIIEMFTTTDEAATAGYYCDLVYADR